MTQSIGTDALLAQFVQLACRTEAHLGSPAANVQRRP